MQNLEGSGTPILYIGSTVLKGLKEVQNRSWTGTECIYIHRPKFG